MGKLPQGPLFDASENQFTGTLPHGLASLLQVTSITLDRNNLVRTLPSFTGIKGPLMLTAQHNLKEFSQGAFENINSLLLDDNESTENIPTKLFQLFRIFRIFEDPFEAFARNYSSRS